MICADISQKFKSFLEVNSAQSTLRIAGEGFVLGWSFEMPRINKKSMYKLIILTKSAIMI